MPTDPASSPSLLPSDGHLTLVTLGDAGIFGTDADGVRRTVLGPGKPLALITYLRLSPGHSATRDTLIGLLWSDIEGERARHALRQTLWQLRQTLGDTALAGKDELVLELPLRADRDEFLAAVERRDLEAAVALYRGPFLPGFAAPGGAGFEQWADLERDRLRGIFLGCSETLVRRRLASSEFREAQKLARRARDLSDRSELGWRLLLESLTASRDFISAGVDADALEVWSAAEGIPLEPATRAAIRLARQVAASEPADSPSGFVAELIGREREFATIVAAWEAAKRGPAQRIRIEAAAGLGKTRLLHDVAARLIAGGTRVLLVRANMGERGIPFAFASELARAVSGLPGAMAVSPGSAASLVGLNPTLSSRFSAAPDQSTGSEGLRKRALALGEAIAAVAEEASFALFIDDLHWNDAESLQILEAVESRLDRARVLLVTARRPRRESGPQPGGAVTLTLSPLTATQVEQFVRSLGELPPKAVWAPQLLDGLTIASEGSPLLLLETLRLATDREILALGPEGWTCRDPLALDVMLGAGEGLRARVARLSREERWLLLLLAAAGTPVELAPLGPLVGRGQDELDRNLNRLEHLGLITREAESVETAHDTIAEAALDTAAPETLHAAERALGLALAAQANGEGSRLVRAARHLAAANSRPELARLFYDYVLRCRQCGDRRPVNQLAAELLGDPTDRQQIATLVAGLPRAIRVGLWSPRRRWAAFGAAALLVALIGSAVLRPRLEPPDNEAILWRNAASHTVAIGHLPIRANGWRLAPNLALPSAWDRFSDSLLTQVYNLMVAPNGRDFVFSQSTGNETTIDIFSRTNDRVGRLTSEPRDDDAPVPSPDGKWIVFLTARWSPKGADDYDLAVMAAGGAAPRRLTRTSDWDGAASWAPDALRLGFTRVTREAAGSHLVCWVTFDARIEQCRPAPDGTSTVVGWLDGESVLLKADAGDRSDLIQFGIDDGSTKRLYSGRFSAATLSSDGAWVGVYGSQSSDEPPSWFLLPTNDPQAVRQLSVPPSEGVVHLAWSARWTRPRFLDTLTITGPSRIPLDAVSRLTASGKTSLGERVPLVPALLRWTTGDSSVASIDSLTGDLTPHRLGTVTATVSAGGWRTRSAVITIAVGQSRTVFEEAWDSIGSSRWRRFGSPLPRVEAGPRGIRGMMNAGDGSYPSGVYTLPDYSAATGIGFEVMMSTPVNRDQWQALSVGFVSTRQHPMAEWDHTTGTYPSIELYQGESCAFSYPGGEGTPLMRSALVSAALTDHRFALDSTLGVGAWYRVRVQVLADGRCGVAVNRKPLWISSASIPTDQRYRIWLAGHSAGTKMLAGPLDVWEGVRNDVDWSTLKR